MEKSKFKYYKLGKKASLFFDPITRVKVTPSSVVAIPLQQTRKNKKIATAIQNHHLVEVDEEQYKAATADKEDEEVDTDNPVEGLASTLGKLKKDELLQYLTDNYEVEDEELEKVQGFKKKADIVDYILALEEEAEGED